MGTCSSGDPEVQGIMEAVQALTGWWAKVTDVVAAGEKEVSSGSKWSASVQIFREPKGRELGQIWRGVEGERKLRR